jgi:poly(3-hydroxybutyrate) depolymerase
MSGRARLVLVALLACVAHAFAQASIDYELARTFEKGRVHARIDGALRDIQVSQALELLPMLPLGTFRGVVVYLHGCDGINTLSVKTADLLAMQGFIVFMPDSFARISKPVSCQPSLYLGGLHREVLSWRHAEADYAIKRLKALPTMDASKLILMGLSEGAIATATYVGEPIAARIIEGWSCHSGWPEYSGLRAPPDEPTLAISSENDPWFQKPELRGECGEYIGPPSALRRSMVFRAPHPAASAHDLMWNADARLLVFEFLGTVTSKSP